MQTETRGNDILQIELNLLAFTLFSNFLRFPPRRKLYNNVKIIEKSGTFLCNIAFKIRNKDKNISTEVFWISARG